MNLATLHTRALNGVQAAAVTIEVHISNGLPKFLLVGLPETAVKESKDRVRSAIINSQFSFPYRHMTVNLAPADLPKVGSRYDLPVALGILMASKQLKIDLMDEYEVIGELALSGELRAVKGVLPIAIAAKKAGRKLILPKQNADEASLIKGLDIYPAEHLLEVCSHLNGAKILPAYQAKIEVKPASSDNDLQEVQGQKQGRRALEIAAAGAHSLLMHGPPGTGKTLLASCLPSILPEMTDDEALEVAALQSITGGGFDVSRWKQRPFRSPHHTASSVALVGGGSPPRPGEISLAHNGALFLDELPEFKRSVLEALREPIESGSIMISRAAWQTEFPARFQLIAAMNPCPCGYLGDLKANCRCTEEQVQRYRQRLSGPLMDRIDMHLEVARVDQKLLLNAKPEQNESSATVRERVSMARQIQIERVGKPSSLLSSKELREYVVLTKSQKQWLESAAEKLNLSARSFHRILRVTRTIADLAGCEQIEQNHLVEALQFRFK